MSWNSTAVVQKEQTWTVQAESSSGESLALEYASEAQARYIAAVLSLGPSTLPKAAIVNHLAQLPMDETQPTGIAVKRARSRRS
ncbi:MAG: hypothetical protein ACO1OB_23890 [Archangium sp.]